MNRSFAITYKWWIILLMSVSICIITLQLSFGASPIIIDHTCTDISQIPTYWLEQAKQLTIHYAHTSHGSQINSGILNLESQNPAYSVAIRTSTTAGLPPLENPSALRMYDGNPPETYIAPDDYWDGESGKNRTRAVVDTGDYGFSMWSWCGQVSGATQSYIQNYLDTLNQFENECPVMKFIYMTGHLDGTGSGGSLHIRNEQIRSYCIANNKVLFDFADIERYDPDGNDYLDLGANDNCDYSGGNWADEWCAVNPGSDLCASCSCAHSKALNCNRKARAFWWMMARLAGWDPNGAPARPVPFGQNVTEVTGDDRANAVVTIGSVVTGGDQMALAINFSAYEAAVDIYAAVQLPDGSLYLVASDGSMTMDLVPYRTAVTTAQSATILNAFDVCPPSGASVPTGTWNVYAMVIPTNGGNFSAIDFTNGNYNLWFYSFDVTCP